MKQQLTVKQVLALKELGRHSLGGNLFLRIRITKAGKLSRAFEFKWMKDGKERTQGLGSILRVSPAKARIKAARARLILDEGNDPFPPKQAPAPAPETFRSCALAYIQAKGVAWTPKHRREWLRTIDVHLAALADLPVKDVDPVVIECLAPLWTRIPGTATKIRGMGEMIVESAKSRGLRSGDNPFRWEGHLKNIFARPANGHHHEAMPYGGVADFMRTLRTNESTAARALEFTILTACRSGEVRGARWDEFDLDAKVWTIPANRMKAGKEHRVPLSDRAIEIIGSLAARRISDFVFGGARAQAPIGKMAMADLVPAPSTVHGFRSSFRDWAGNETRFPREIAEQALAHAVGNGTEQAYRRGDALGHRRELMTAWERFCVHSGKGKVVALRAAV